MFGRNVCGYTVRFLSDHKLDIPEKGVRCDVL